MATRAKRKPAAKKKPAAKRGRAATAKQTTRSRTSVRAKARARATPARKVAKKTTRATKTATHAKKTAKKTRAKKTARTTRKSVSGAAGDIRVRMYRVGFGDFFLLTVPTRAGPQHILIDCGVHAGNIGSMEGCVADLIEATNRKLALVIVTHYHADHLSGFATQADEFAQFDVGAVWITNRLDPDDRQAMAFRLGLATLANHLRLQLQMRLRLALDEDQESIARQALAKAENALGVALGASGAAGNEKALDVVTNRFRNKPPVFYYEAGDAPTLPPSLEGALAAEILGPAPKDEASEFTASDNRLEQYLAAAGNRGLPDASACLPFDRSWPASAYDYPNEAFRPWRTATEMEKTLHAVQPDALAASADLLDGTLNNQSLVVLFTCKGKKLLFAGDAQWGNWAYWLYGRGVKGKDPGISERAQEILGDIDFYKVGHHGSTNATPIPVVAAMSDKCVAMCSTETGFPSKKRTYGSIPKKTEVPRIALMEALEERTGDKAVRSDWIRVGDAPASPEAHAQLERLPANFTAGDLYIDYVLRT